MQMFLAAGMAAVSDSLPGQLCRHGETMSHPGGMFGTPPRCYQPLQGPVPHGPPFFSGLSGFDISVCAPSPKLIGGTRSCAISAAGTVWKCMD